MRDAEQSIAYYENVSPTEMERVSANAVRWREKVEDAWLRFGQADVRALPHNLIERCAVKRVKERAIPAPMERAVRHDDSERMESEQSAPERVPGADEETPGGHTGHVPGLPEASDTRSESVQGVSSGSGASDQRVQRAQEEIEASTEEVSAGSGDTAEQ